MMKPIPKNNKGLPKLPKSVRNSMGFMARGGKAKNYAYGSTVRSPMNPETNMNPQMNPMMPRAQKGMMQPMMGMMYGGKAKKKNGS